MSNARTGAGAARSTESPAAGPLAGAGARRAIDALRRSDPSARAFYLYDLDLVAARARRFVAAFAGRDVLAAYAAKANGLPAILECLCREGIGAEAGSLGEMGLVRAAGFDPARVVLNGNGRTLEEADAAASLGIHSVNADHVGELELLEAAAASHGRALRVALRVNPGIATPGHAYVATGHDEAKFGISPREALEVWEARARWPHLDLGGIHVHVGSQVHDPDLLERATDEALAIARAAADAGARLTWMNLGGGFGVDYDGGAGFPLEQHAQRVAERIANTEVGLVFEPGRWLVAQAGVLLAEVLWVKRRGRRRFVVLAAGMNDFIRPALYHARHRIVAIEPRAGCDEPATVVGPVCESGDVFAEAVALPPVETGDWVAILDTGAYGAAMASNYNGRGRLAEVVARQGTLVLARAAEDGPDPARLRSDRLD